MFFSMCAICFYLCSFASAFCFLLTCQPCLKEKRGVKCQFHLSEIPFSLGSRPLKMPWQLSDTFTERFLKYFFPPFLVVLGKRFGL